MINMKHTLSSVDMDIYEIGSNDIVGKLTFSEVPRGSEVFGIKLKDIGRAVVIENFYVESGQSMYEVMKRIACYFKPLHYKQMIVLIEPNQLIEVQSLTAVEVLAEHELAGKLYHVINLKLDGVFM